MCGFHRFVAIFLVLWFGNFDPPTTHTTYPPERTPLRCPISLSGSLQVVLFFKIVSPLRHWVSFPKGERGVQLVECYHYLVYWFQISITPTAYDFQTFIPQEEVL